MNLQEMEATIRRATTEATARAIRSENSENPPPLNVFLSHAKQDGIPIAESIRDGVRKFGQLEAWYDANDLPIGANWKSPMEAAAKKDTAAMVATVTDAYPTRPWCRREAILARTPVPLKRKPRIWKVQPVVAVHDPGAGWVRGVSMLDGVPRIGWKEPPANEPLPDETSPDESSPDQTSPDEQVERVVDRLVLEVLLGNVHRKLAIELDKADVANRKQTCYITWVPDAWSLSALRHEMSKTKIPPSSIRRIVYPGYGLSIAEVAELEPVVNSFDPEAQLVSFEEAWK